jgi:group I intron endonuclease
MSTQQIDTCMKDLFSAPPVTGSASPVTAYQLSPGERETVLLSEYKLFNGVCGIYSIYNIQACKQYIGSSVDIGIRIETHIRDLRRKKHHSKKLQNAWNKYGDLVWVVKILDRCDKQWILEAEQLCIDNEDSYKSGYNGRSTSEAGGGYDHTDQTKHKVRLSNKAFWNSASGKKIKKRLSNRFKGVYRGSHSVERREASRATCKQLHRNPFVKLLREAARQNPVVKEKQVIGVMLGKFKPRLNRDGNYINTPSELADYILQSRQDGIPYRKLARETGMNRQTIHQWERYANKIKTAEIAPGGCV